MPEVSATLDVGHRSFRCASSGGDIDGFWMPGTLVLTEVDEHGGETVLAETGSSICVARTGSEPGYVLACSTVVDPLPRWATRLEIYDAHQPDVRVGQRSTNDTWLLALPAGFDDDTLVAMAISDDDRTEEALSSHEPVPLHFWIGEPGGDQDASVSW